MVSDKFPDYVPEYLDQGNVFSKTNKWVNAMGVEKDVYKSVNMTATDCVGMSTRDQKNSLILYTIAADDDDECGFTVTIDDAKIGSDVYVYAGSSKGGHATVTVGETSRKFEIRSYQIITLGVYDGTPMTLKVDYYDPPNASPLYVYSYQLDTEGYDEMIKKLSDEQLEVTSYDSTSLNGTVTAKEAGLLFLTIPYSEGWSAWVDGNKTEITPVNDALMAIKLDAGKHDIRIEYIPAGFKPGACITCASVICIILLAVIPAVIGKVRSGKKAAIETAPDTASVSEAPAVMTEDVPAEMPVSAEPSETVITEVQEVPAEAEEPVDEPAPDAGDNEQPKAENGDNEQ